MENYLNYELPFNKRYLDKDMSLNFSPFKKYTTWRKLWYNLAKFQMKMGLNITQEQVDELEKNIENINYDRALEIESEVNHDVMAHIKAYGEQCPNASGIIHLGCTSAYVVDNTDLIVMRDGVLILKEKLIKIIKSLENFCQKYKDLPCQAYTHLQSAQLTTLGKRATGWLDSLLMDYNELEYVLKMMSFRGLKGAVGSQDSFKNMFDKYDTILEIEKNIASSFGFKNISISTTQTYNRKIDNMVMNLLSNISVSFHKITNDIRILQSFGEIEEPFKDKQVGSSAMAYKRNPIKCENISSLCKFVMSLQSCSNQIASTQWLERTLDDSACKRISIPQAFMAVASILNTFSSVIDNIKVYQKVIEKNIEKNKAYIITEKIIMEACKNGGDRQQIHEQIRMLSMEDKVNIQNGMDSRLYNILIEKLNLNKAEFENIDYRDYTGFCGDIVENFLKNIKL